MEDRRGPTMDISYPQVIERMQACMQATQARISCESRAKGEKGYCAAYEIEEMSCYINQLCPDRYKALEWCLKGRSIEVCTYEQKQLSFCLQESLDFARRALE